MYGHVCIPVPVSWEITMRTTQYVHDHDDHDAVLHIVRNSPYFCVCTGRNDR